MSQRTAHPCDLCDSDGGEVIFRSGKWRVVRVTGTDGKAYPGYCRVVWNTHVKELTDLPPADRQHFMDAVFRVAAALRECLDPVKMNVASLGNLTPHLHWHVIPRYVDDPAFPRPVWAVDLAASGGLGTLEAKHRRGSEGGDWEKAVRRALESV